MSSRFQRNRAPGWSSSGEDSSDDEDSGTDDEINDSGSIKRVRTNNQTPPDSSAAVKRGQVETGRKKNNIWTDVLADQQLSGGLLSGVNVMADDTCVARGAETYDCTKAQEKEKPDVVEKGQESRSSNDSGSVKEEFMTNPTEHHDDPFAGEYPDAPDLLSESSIRGKRGGAFGGISGDRKRPWQRGGRQRAIKEKGASSDVGENNQEEKEFHHHGGDRGGYRGRGRGRGRYFYNRGGGQRSGIQKISFNDGDSPKETALAISRSLREIKSELMVKAVENIGKEKSIQLYYQTVDVENSGGLMTLDNRRRRTPGGVFLYLLREDAEITDAQKEELFGAEREQYRQQLKAKRRLTNESKQEPMEAGEKELKDTKTVFLEEHLASAKAEIGAHQSDSDDVMVMDDE